MKDQQAKSGETKKKIRPLAFIGLQAGLFVYSLAGVCSKLAGSQEFLSPLFFLFFGLLFTILLSYALIWQQVLRQVPLTLAYACKSVAGFYTLLWGALIFGEKIRPNMVIGLLLVLAGVSFFIREEAKSGQQEEKEDKADE